MRKGLEVATDDAKMIIQGLGDAKNMTNTIRRGLEGDEDDKKDDKHQ